MNSFGTIFRLSIFGESHGSGIGIIVDGAPPGIDFSAEDMENDLARRRSGARGTTPRQESDIPEILSGIYNNKTTGAPITILFRNSNTRPGDYDRFRDMPRPGHADFTAKMKYKEYSDPRGGGHFSGRITLGIVAAGALAKKILPSMKISSQITETGGEKDYAHVIEQMIEEKDSAGGIVEVTAAGIPAGIGEPFFNSMESCLSHLVFSIPAVRGIEFGAGFESARMKGSMCNDPFISADGKTSSNNAGGINGGITNGNDLIFRVAVKPASSIGKAQETINLKSGVVETLEVEGRHDACIVLRTPVIFEACAAIAAADLFLVNKIYN
jgi:chorismate synthase